MIKTNNNNRLSIDNLINSSVESFLDKELKDSNMNVSELLACLPNVTIAKLILLDMFVEPNFDNIEHKKNKDIININVVSFNPIMERITICYDKIYNDGSIDVNRKEEMSFSKFDLLFKY